ncbi:MAG TPA: hypothetical protein VHM64_25285, partial [Candidatus Binatia bacterium]|nr:hypothetical protein [Candidatus Binatia bacterium]
TSAMFRLVVAGEYAICMPALLHDVIHDKEKGTPIDYVKTVPPVVFPRQAGISGKAPNPNAARLYYDFSLSKEGQEMMRGMQRIPVRKDVEPNPPRLFRGYKRVVENPEDYKDFEGLVRLYNEIFKLR